MPTGIPLLRKKVSKNFLQKSIDKLKGLCYTKYVRLREGNRFALRKLKAMNRRYGAREERKIELILTLPPSLDGENRQVRDSIKTNAPYK